MKINPPAAVLTIVAAAFATLALHRQTEKPRTLDQQCAAVIAFIQYTLENQSLKRDGRQFLLTVEDMSDIKEAINSGSEELKNMIKRDPFYSLYIQFPKLNGVDPKHKCASLSEFLKQDGVKQRFTSEQPKLKGRKGQEEWNAIFLGISMPAISDNGREAIMQTSMVFGPLGGGGSEVYLRKSDRGDWIVKYESPSGIS